MVATPLAEADADAIVIGAGHNGLVTAAYLAQAGLRTTLIEARSSVGGTAASEPFAGATVNICNCDHLTFRTTPISEELGLAEMGLRYLDVEPAQANLAWDGRPAWLTYHDVGRTLDGLGRHYADEVDGYRQYLRAALPVVRMILAAAAEPPSVAGLARTALDRRFRGAATMMRWSRRSAASIMRDFFTADALRGPAMVTGPMVWGISPELPGTGLGALTYALRHAGTVGRPVGGSGMVPESIRRRFEAAGGTLLLSTRVQAITCEGNRVRGVLIDGEIELRSPIVVSACNPHDTFLAWLRNPPSSAAPLINRWRGIPHAQGYESKLDAVLTEVPRLRALAHVDDANAMHATAIVAPSLADIDGGFRLMNEGRVLDRPAMFLNVPTVLDPSMAPPGQHVLSLEVLYTPYGLTGGWAATAEPARWLDRLGDITEPGWREGVIDWRAMTPDRYEREFHLPAGHATSFAGGPVAAVRNNELTRYGTSIPGLYLTGAATFPGAGVWGASGRNAALTILRDRGAIRSV